MVEMEPKLDPLGSQAMEDGDFTWERGISFSLWAYIRKLIDLDAALSHGKKPTGGQQREMGKTLSSKILFCC